MSAQTTPQPKHTPGPFEAIISSTGEPSFRSYQSFRAVIRSTTTDGAIAFLIEQGDETTNPQLQADALLFAAAPELLAALQKLVAADNCNYDRDGMRYEGYFDAARKAIAKATGESVQV